MTIRRPWLAVAVMMLLLAGGTGIAFWRRPVKREPPAPPATANPVGTVKFLMEQQWLIRMKLALVESRRLARQITSTGRVIPAAGHRALVAPPVGGLIVEGPLPRVGQQVVQGQTVADLHQTPTAAESAQIEAGQAQLRIEASRFEAERRRLVESANEALVRLNHARAEFERAQRLYERKAYSQRQVQAAEAEYRGAESVYAATIAQRDALRETPQAPAGLGPRARYEVRAPISGTVVKVHKSIGEQAAPGEAILEIINLDTVWVEAPIFERDLSRIGKQARAIFTTAADPARELVGRVIDLGAVIDQQSRAATLIFEVPNPTRALRIGMQANVRLDAGETLQAMLIPREAVLESEGKKIAYVLLSGEEFQRREVTVGDEYGEHVAVLLGLKAGERVVTQGAYQLRQHELRPASPGAHTHES